MVLLHEVDPEELTTAYNNHHIQQACFDYIKNIRRYDHTQNNDFLEDALESALQGYDLLPFDGVSLNDEIVDSPSEVMLIVCDDMRELDIVDFGEYESKE